MSRWHGWQNRSVAEQHCSFCWESRESVPSQSSTRGPPAAGFGRHLCFVYKHKKGTQSCLPSLEAGFLKTTWCTLGPYSFKLLPCKFRGATLKKINDLSHRNCRRTCKLDYIYVLLQTMKWSKVTQFLRWRKSPNSEQQHRWWSLAYASVPSRWPVCADPEETSLTCSPVATPIPRGTSACKI